VSHSLASGRADGRAGTRVQLFKRAQFSGRFVRATKRVFKLDDLHSSEAQRLASTVTRRPRSDDGPVSADLRIRFAQNVKAARLAIGISQRDLAKLAGVARSYVFAIEHGTANVTLEMVMLFGRALAKEPTDLLKPPPSPTAHRPTKK
jgi:DNA-binding XRE family transcriptional regulator